MHINMIFGPIHAQNGIIQARKLRFRFNSELEMKLNLFQIYNSLLSIGIHFFCIKFIWCNSHINTNSRQRASIFKV